MLKAHGVAAHHSPSWFLYSRHAFDANANWKLIQSTLHDYLEGGLHWLKKRCEVDENDFWLLAQEEIKNEFEIQHHTKLLEATCNEL